jgi:hypothetical protein
MSDTAIVNGSLTPQPSSEPRHAVGEGVALSIAPAASSALFRRSGIKYPGGRRTTLLVGELDGVRVGVTRRDGITHIVLTRDDIAP